MTKRLYFIAHGGTVQGVGFRYFTQNKAREYGITGWCRNTPNNKVEGEAQGTSDAVDKLMKDVEQGPRHANVVQLTKENRDAVNGESTFEVRQ